MARTIRSTSSSPRCRWSTSSLASCSSPGWRASARSVRVTGHLFSPEPSLFSPNLPVSVSTQSAHFPLHSALFCSLPFSILVYSISSLHLKVSLYLRKTKGSQLYSPSQCAYFGTFKSDTKKVSYLNIRYKLILKVGMCHQPLKRDIISVKTLKKNIFNPIFELKRYK